MTCQGCANTVVKALEAAPGVVKAEVNLLTGSALVTYAPDAARHVEARVGHARLLPPQLDHQAEMPFGAMITGRW